MPIRPRDKLISRFDANDEIVQHLERGESIVAAAKMAIGHFALAGGSNRPTLVELCLTEGRLLIFEVEPSFNRCTGKLMNSIPISEISACDSQVGRYFWGPRYCRLSITLCDGGAHKFQASLPVKRAIVLSESLLVQLR
jgi:hypothetical protein